jgi:hypothetical protein
MKFLKNKVSMAVQRQLVREKQARTNEANQRQRDDIRETPKSIITTRDANRKNYPMFQGPGSTKNIVKNYGRAICNFAVSEIALPYINKYIEQTFSITALEDFIKYVESIKELVVSIESLKGILLENSEDAEKLASLKKIFKHVSVIFIKYFSVNWIFSGRLTYKLSHLRYRNKMLRRVENPELFTYLKPHSKGTIYILKD